MAPYTVAAENTRTEEHRMDPQQRRSTIEEAKVAGLFNVDFAPEEDLDSLEIVETAGGDGLIFTNLEAAHYADAQVKANAAGDVEAIFGERTMLALERLGRLRAARLVELRNEPGPPADPLILRDRVLAALELELDAVDEGADELREARPDERIANLAGAYRALEPGVQFGTELVAEPGVGTVNKVASVDVSELEARRVAGHVYQRVQGAGHQAEAAEEARAAVLEALEELRNEATR